MTLCKVLYRKKVNDFSAQEEGRTQETLVWQNNYYLISTMIFA